MEELPSWASIVLTGFFSLIFILKLFVHLQPPPSPMALPVIGHLHLIGYRVHQSFHKLSAILRPLLHVMLGSVPFIVASDAAAARDILREHEKCFVDRKAAETITRLTYEGRSFVFSPYGDYWRFMKKLELQWIRKEEVRKLLGLLYEKAERRQDVDFGAALKSLSNNVICQMTVNQMMNIVEETMTVMGTPNVADFVGFCGNIDLQQLRRRADKVHCSFDNLMERILVEEENARKENPPKTAAAGAARCLQVLLDIHISKEGSTEKRMTREHINSLIHVTTRAKTTTILFSFLSGFHAGSLLGATDTTSVTVEWALAELRNHPTILRDARREIDTVVGLSRLVEESDVPNLPFLLAIVKETLRLHPAFPIFPRHSNAPCKARGYSIPADTRVAINVSAIGRDPTHWDNPLEFQPERFTASGRSFGVDDMSGSSLALPLIQTTLATVIQCFDMSVVGGVADMTEGHGATLTRAHRLVCTPKTRLTFLP
ncbi:unnamed protein product [Spirodela intermedia]|uniref:Uncharacterized protein n=1 Tax=Spirodela intermedia TaxID=51605 RepID=A0A7I8JQB2_SPIIN|nr:unnamed protein product [Spirodela intermedia]CAA6672320.1 unnamed protein product [Spirodela intermedia]